MKKILIAGSAAVLTALAFAATPASAGGFTVHVGGFGHGHGWRGHQGGVYIAAPRVYRSSWARHVDWCYDHKGGSYDPDSNTYVTRRGNIRTCNSPFL